MDIEKHLREEKLKKEVSRVFPLVSKLIETEKTSAAAASIIAVNIIATACLSLNITPNEFKSTLDSLLTDYECNWKAKNARQD